jgi:hypothetical protein
LTAQSRNTLSYRLRIWNVAGNVTGNERLIRGQWISSTCHHLLKTDHGDANDRKHGKSQYISIDGVPALYGRMQDKQLDSVYTDLRLAMARCARQRAKKLADVRQTLVSLCRVLSRQEASDSEILVAQWSRSLGSEQLDLVIGRWQMIANRLKSMWESYLEDERFPYFAIGPDADEGLQMGQGFQTVDAAAAGRIVDGEAVDGEEKGDRIGGEKLHRWMSLEGNVDRVNRYYLAVVVCGIPGRQWKGEWARWVSVFCSCLLRSPTDELFVADHRFPRLIYLDYLANGQTRLHKLRQPYWPLGERRAGELKAMADNDRRRLTEKWTVEYLTALVDSDWCYVEWQPSLLDELKGDSVDEKRFSLRLIINPSLLE